MKKKFTVIFFSINFLASLMAEAYCLVVLEGELISTVGMGIVVLIMGYLLLDSIREQWTRNSQNIRFYLEQMYRDNTEKWNERYTELLNLHKATYTAAKKNDALMEEKLQAINTVLEAMDKNNASALKMISEFQRKSLEGQKNALNIEVNYNKENTKQLIQTIQEEIRRQNPKDQLSLLLTLLQEKPAADFKPYDNGFSTDNTIEEEEEVITNNASPPTITPLYEDPNKALTPDEIAALFASFGN